ncbi:MAG TPA: hypothetical protein VFA46_08775 [Actinomycetes bacterium]|nr:hypothetical protein [Actinomycetes bacterium]
MQLQPAKAEAADAPGMTPMRACGKAVVDVAGPPVGGEPGGTHGLASAGGHTRRADGLHNDALVLVRSGDSPA